MLRALSLTAALVPTLLCLFILTGWRIGLEEPHAPVLPPRPLALPTCRVEDGCLCLYFIDVLPGSRQMVRCGKRLLGEGLASPRWPVAGAASEGDSDRGSVSRSLETALMWVAWKQPEGRAQD